MTKARRIEIKPDDYNYVFSPYLEPVAHVKPGDDVIIYTEDATGGRIRSKDDLPKKALKTVKFLNPQTGPIYIEGAEPGDTLVVKIKDIESTGLKEMTWGLMEGQKVAQLLEELIVHYGDEFGHAIYEKDGQQRADLRILLNGWDTRFLEEEKLILQDDDIVLLLPVLAGG